ncbi:MAG: DUF2798 domain-containing protein [Methylocella sp.]
MLKIPRRFNHFVFGVIQSGLTCAVATAIARLSFPIEGSAISSWLASWLLSWATLLPIVFLAATLIRKVANLLTYQQYSVTRVR